MVFYRVPREGEDHLQVTDRFMAFIEYQEKVKNIYRSLIDL
jgi:hypothetical protein